MIHAAPNLNGNSSGDFLAASRRMLEAAAVLEAAVTSFRMNVVHGRNYQTIAGDRKAAYEADRARLDAIRDAVTMARELAYSTAEASA